MFCDIDQVNRILNHPAVFPHVRVGLPWPIDAHELAAREDVILLMLPTGGFILIEEEPGILRAHVAFLPEVRGRAAIIAGKCAIESCFDAGFQGIIGRVPVANRACRRYCRLIGMRSAGVNDEVEVFVAERSLH